MSPHCCFASLAGHVPECDYACFADDDDYDSHRDYHHYFCDSVAAAYVFCVALEQLCYCSCLRWNWNQNWNCAGAAVRIDAHDGNCTQVALEEVFLLCLQVHL